MGGKAGLVLGDPPLGVGAVTGEDLPKGLPPLEGEEGAVFGVKDARTGGEPVVDCFVVGDALAGCGIGDDFTGIDGDGFESSGAGTFGAVENRDGEAFEGGGASCGGASSSSSSSSS